MNLPMKWLREFVDIDVSPKTFSESMTMTGSKVEAVIDLGADIQNVVVGKIESIRKHPGADKLQICMLDVGKSDPVQIITGATNVAVDDLVPVALDHSVLPGGKTITAGQLRGLDSFGMLCSISELGLTLNNIPDAVEDGILILHGDFKIGMDIRSALGLDDISYEFEITSNRPDCLSIIGLAREASATFHVPLKLHEPKVKACDESINGRISVSVEAPDLCPRYTARMVTDVKIEPSPKWMRERLHAAGVRPINNIVDITNYVMFEYGQPMHAFDFNCIKGGEIIVRRARSGEIFKTLDDQDRALKQDMLVIADCEKPVAIAGVMGGANSEITDSTKTVVFESANFKAASVRVTARGLGMRTDSSARYEKGLDPQNTMPAIERACELVELLGAGRVLSGVIDIDSSNKTPRRIVFEPERINSLLGTDIKQDKMISMLNMLEIKQDGNHLIIPSWRADVECTADIAEEVARLYGYNEIPSTPLRGESTQGGLSKKQKFEKSITSVSRSLGYSECITYSFINPKYYDLIALPENSPLRKCITILNPLGDETSTMRTTMLPSMLEVLARNYNYRNLTARLFEMGTVYMPKLNAAGEVDTALLPDERSVFVIGAYGKANDFYTIKGAVEAIFSALSVKDVSFEPENELSTWHPGRCARIYSGNSELGIIGEIHPNVCKAFDVELPVYIAELDIEKMINSLETEREYRPLPKFPAITRDLAIVCDSDLPVAHLEKCIRICSADILEGIELFDVYTGTQVPEGKKSVAYSIKLRSNDHTLKDDEADRFVTEALNTLKKQFGAELRN